MSVESVRGSDEGLVKVRFELSDSNGETIWAEPMGYKLYELRNVPVFAFGFSFEDVVEAQFVDGRLNVTRVVRRGGHSTYRIVVDEGATQDSFLMAWNDLKRLGCTYERAAPRMIAVDVPKEADVHEVYSILEMHEHAGLWVFEEGHCGHPV